MKLRKQRPHFLHWLPVVMAARLAIGLAIYGRNG